MMFLSHKDIEEFLFPLYRIIMCCLDTEPACECRNGDGDCKQDGYICKDCTCRPGNNCI